MDGRAASCKFASLERAKQIRGVFQSIMGDIRHTKVLVITLGLVESWYDNEAGIYLNTAPATGLIAKYPGRFDVHVLGYADNMRHLEQIYEIVKAATRAFG